MKSNQLEPSLTPIGPHPIQDQDPQACGNPQDQDEEHVIPIVPNVSPNCEVPPIDANDLIQDDHLSSNEEGSNEDISQESIEEKRARREAQVASRLRVKDHPMDNILGDVRAKVTTRRQLASFSTHHAFVSFFEPKKVYEALEDQDWI